ncbi:DUF2955 domain-containing protein [Thiomicrorhabdus hydrogeniphila]
MIILKNIPLTDNMLRRSIRVAFGATLGFAICKILGWDYGVFFTIFPILLLGLVPKMNGHAARQLLSSSALTGVEVSLLGGLFGTHPGMMIPIVFVLFLYRFISMSKGSLFLFGATGTVSLSIMLHFASYQNTDINDMIFTNFIASIFSTLIAFVLITLIPDKAENAPKKPPKKQANRMRHESIMGASVATLSFVAFQVFDLYDSLSAQVTTVLLLFPMHWNGSLTYARQRSMGSMIGVSYALIVQLLLQNWSDTLLFVVMFLWLGTLIFGQWHVKEAAGSGVGFSAMTTLAVLFGMYLTPQNDLVYSSLYRVSSISVAIIGTLIAIYVMHYVLNQFKSTSYSAAAT